MPVNQAAAYLDTSFLLKAYLAEPESEAVLQWLAAPDAVPALSALTDIEIVSSLFCKATPEEARESYRSYQLDRSKQLYQELPLTRAVFQAAEQLAVQYAGRFLLRSFDILHLATARQYGITRMATFDRRLATAAAHLGLSVMGIRL